MVQKLISKPHCRILSIMNNMQLEMLHKLSVSKIIYMPTINVQIYRVWNWAYHKHESNFEVQASNLECFKVLMLGSLRHANQWWSLLEIVHKLCFWLLFVNIMVLVIIVDYGGEHCHAYDNLNWAWMCVEHTIDNWSCCQVDF